MRTAILLLLVGCSNPIKPCVLDDDCAGIGQPVCSAQRHVCVEGAVRAPLIGKGDGTAGSVTLTSVYASDQPRQPTGLAFNPMHPEELWILSYGDDSAVTVTNPGTADANVAVRTDPAAGHFMHKPTGIAFADDDSWGTCGENDNTTWGDKDFTGPAAFSADASIFSKRTSGGLGSHLDMLHDSPFCMGIAHERDHVFWVLDGRHSSLSRYDFHSYHPPGGDDHSDGEVAVYVQGQVKRAAGIPSGMAFDPSDGQLYAADTGNGRIVKLDTASGTKGKNLPSFEPTVPFAMDGATLVDFVAAGTLQAPSGLVLQDGVFYVSDNSSSKLYAFDGTGLLLRTLDTGLPAGSLAGLTVGPDGKMYFVDMIGSQAYRIDSH